MLMFAEAIDQVLYFLERGGDVLLFIMLVILVMWACIIERFVFFAYGIKAMRAELNAAWQARAEHSSWHAKQIREALLSEANAELNRYFPLIKTLIALCPLLGLLGTVTGMIEVFDVMAFMGSSSPKAMAAGISKATIPTMGGMVGALSGVFTISILQRQARARQQQLAELLRAY